MGGFEGTQVTFQDNRLKFTQNFNPPPEPDWKDGTKIEAWADTQTLTFNWKSKSSSGKVTLNRKKLQ